MSTLKTLFLDIETHPNTAYVWRLYNQDVSTEQLLREHDVICFAAKWEDSPEILFWSKRKHGERVMLRAAHRLLDQADVVVTYNGNQFDLTHLNRKFLQMKLTPPSPYEKVDLLDVVRRQFLFPSNKLEAVAPSIGLGRKVTHEGFRLWRRCMAGDAKAWDKMERYNRKDVILLARLYHRLRPWIPGHPVRTLYDPSGTCPVCGSNHVQSRGSAHTRLGVYPRFQCQSCGSWLRGKKRERGANLRSFP